MAEKKYRVVIHGKGGSHSVSDEYGRVEYFTKREAEGYSRSLTKYPSSIVKAKQRKPRDTRPLLQRLAHGR